MRLLTSALKVPRSLSPRDRRVIANVGEVRTTFPSSDPDPFLEYYRASRATIILGSTSLPFSMMTLLSSVTVQSRIGTS